MSTFFDVVSGGSSTASTKIPETTELVLGEKYRLRLTLTGPYNADTPARIKAAIETGAGLNNALASQHFLMKNIVRIDKVDVSAPTQDQRLFRWDAFTVDVYFTKVGQGTPILLVIGVVVAVVLFALGLLFVVTNREVFHEARETIGSDLPAFAGSLVAPALAIALVLYFWKR